MEEDPTVQWLEGEAQATILQPLGHLPWSFVG